MYFCIALVLLSHLIFNSCSNYLEAEKGFMTKKSNILAQYLKPIRELSEKFPDRVIEVQIEMKRDTTKMKTNELKIKHPKRNSVQVGPHNIRSGSNQDNLTQIKRTTVKRIPNRNVFNKMNSESKKISTEPVRYNEVMETLRSFGKMMENMWNKTIGRQGNATTTSTELTTASSATTITTSTKVHNECSEESILYEATQPANLSHFFQALGIKSSPSPISYNIQDILGLISNGVHVEKVDMDNKGEEMDWVKIKIPKK